MWVAPTPSERGIDRRRAPTATNAGGGSGVLAPPSRRARLEDQGAFLTLTGAPIDCALQADALQQLADRGVDISGDC